MLFRSLIKDHTNEPYWCADENYTSDVLWHMWKSHKVKWSGLNFGKWILNWNEPKKSVRVDRYFWNGKEYDSVFGDALKRNQYIDIHCHRDYFAQEPALIRILSLAGMISR